MKNKYKMTALTHSYKGPKSVVIMRLSYHIAFMWKLLQNNYRTKLFNLEHKDVLFH